MKSNLKTIGYLIAFVIGGIIFQISCSNSDDDGNQSPPATPERIVYVKTNVNNANQSIWTCNLDGTGHLQVPIILPTNFVLGAETAGRRTTIKLASNGQRILFTAIYLDDNSHHMYSCNLDGSDLIHLGSTLANEHLFFN